MHYTITTQCNNNCICCVTDKALRSKVLCEPKLHGPSTHDEPIVVSGGEPTIAKSFFRFLTASSIKLKPLLILTNARAFSDNVFLKKFLDCNLYKKNTMIATALYSDKANEHDKMTRVSGSFEQTIRGLNNLIAKGFNIEIRIIINRNNYYKLPAIAEFIINSMKGINRVAFIQMKISGQAKDNLKELIVKYEDTLAPLMNSLKILSTAGIEVHLLHHPLCLLPAEAQLCTKGRTADIKELYFPKQCDECYKKGQCSGIWKNYCDVFGEDSFTPFGPTGQ